MYSQNDEDGIIIEIFNRIGSTKKIFVELDAGNGIENNTYALLFQNWKGLWIDGNKKKIKSIIKQLPRTLSLKQLIVKNAFFITKDNIDNLISSEISEHEIDLLSIDLDGNDIHIFESIKCIKPRVVILEYNAKFIPPVEYCMKYKNLLDGTGQIMEALH